MTFSNDLSPHGKTPDPQAVDNVVTLKHVPLNSAELDALTHPSPALKAALDAVAAMGGKTGSRQ